MTTDPAREVPPDPLNQEAPLGALGEPVTPTADFYRRSNFSVPRLDPERWRLDVAGEVRRPLSLSRADLEGFTHRTVAVTLECAGNGRNLMEPVPPGTPWGLGAVSTAEFSGVRLREVLERADPTAAAVEALFEGADRGRADLDREEPFARCLPLDVAMEGDALLAWAMNGEPLTEEHGFPLRLVVPGWYGMASVKWLVAVRLLAEPFRGSFQTERYVYRGEAGIPDGTPVSRIRVRSLIASPADGAVLPPGPVEVRGTAWSGHAPVERVEVSTDGGASWTAAVLGTPPSPYAAAPWHLTWLPPGPGEYRILARAADAAGNVQPLVPVTNELGYANNVVQQVRLMVV